MKLRLILFTTLLVAAVALSYVVYNVSGIFTLLAYEHTELFVDVGV